MQIGGLIKLSLIDYPGKTAAVVFVQGCNFRCPYCHNKELVIPACFGELIPQQEIMSFLIKRQELLEGVVVSGGEPTLQKDLPEFLREIRCLGFKIKLDTNGSRPDVLEQLLREKLVDFIAMDIKASFERYHVLSGVAVDTALIQRSIDVIKSSGIDHQFRTTVVKSLIEDSDLTQIASLVKGSKSYVLQNVILSSNLVDPSLVKYPTYSDQEFKDIKERWEMRV